LTLRFAGTKFKVAFDGELENLNEAFDPHWCSHHVKIGYDFGVSDTDIEALVAQSALPVP
jgi:hypothetical protein